MTGEQMTRGRDWSGQDIAGWFWTEKLDGCHAYWDGSALWSLGGNVIPAPEWFTRGLPKMHLEGEIYAGIGSLESARLAVQHGRFVRGEHTFVVFECPHARGNYAERMTFAKGVITRASCASAVRVQRAKDYAQMRSRLRAIKGKGGEGIMLRNPTIAAYEKGRTGNLLKFKTPFC